jgi:hypothetical protein
MDRREFLKGTAAAGAAAVLPLSILPEKEEPKIEEPKLELYDNPPDYRPRIYIPRPPDWLYPHDPKGFYYGFYILGHGWIHPGYGGPYPSLDRVMHILWDIPSHKVEARYATSFLQEWWHTGAEHDLVFYDSWVDYNYKEETGPRCNTRWFRRVKILPGTFSVTKPNGNNHYYPRYKGSFQYREVYKTDAILATHNQHTQEAWQHYSCHQWAEEVAFRMKSPAFQML